MEFSLYINLYAQRFWENMSVVWCSKPLLTNGENPKTIETFSFWILSFGSGACEMTIKNIENDDDDDGVLVVVFIFFLFQKELTSPSFLNSQKEWNKLFVAWNFRVFYVLIFISYQ